MVRTEPNEKPAGEATPDAGGRRLLAQQGLEAQAMVCLGAGALSLVLPWIRALAGSSALV